MYAQTLPISNFNLNPTKPPSSLNPYPSPTQFAKFQSVSKFRYGFCNSTRRVSDSPNLIRKHVNLAAAITCEALQGKDDEKDNDDGFYIRRCLELARKAIGCTSPNPMVGCVIVKDGKIIGEGFHPKAGQPHAEVFALRHAGELAEGATAYVSLEPCNHFGRTPPCSEALIKAKLKKVVVGMVDPNPIVASRGVAKLQDAGIDVTVGVEEEMCKKLNEAWIHHMKTGNPFVTLRYSLTINGGLSDEIGEESMDVGGYYSKLLQEHDAVVVSSKSLEKYSVPESKEPNSNQRLRVIIGKNPSIPHLEESDSKGIKTLVFDEVKLGTILEHCKGEGLCSVLVDLRGGVGDFEEILKGVEGNLVQKLLVEVLPVWGGNKEGASLEAIKIGQRAGLKSFEPKIVGKSVILEGYF